MYVPQPFEMNDEEAMYQLMKENSFATVFTHHHGAPFASQLPLIVDETERVIYGHFARTNPQWKDAENQQVLIIFQGPHCYISPAWYNTKQAVPTWNYTSVHVSGELELIENQENILEVLSMLVRQHEPEDSSYHLQDAGRDYIENLSKGIAAFKIRITKMEGKAKLSQNHPPERQARVIQALERLPGENEQKIAALMKRNLKE
ncbi:FMN-binding negative transcriptional regulator [Bacillus sp. FJAT-42376]|uniref:FMN-binding negative transcriptional regulator n=1 Tax=Bacillus sp. FJAT-42376 TaxID=2014076 RepID=UPI000F4EC263|nr:FMN-binding negative transcriptional regulator [Bacillus sp. FJAT-42376]AZB41960.1 FMN-binding negative transcriptional regulator [Bacillus sp. FJAT-42376]